MRAHVCARADRGALISRATPPRQCYTSLQLLRAGRQPLSAAAVEVQRLLASSSALRGLLIVFTCYTVSTALSKVSLAYISVPLQVVVKSGKSAHSALCCRLASAANC